MAATQPIIHLAAVYAPRALPVDALLCQLAPAQQKRGRSLANKRQQEYLLGRLLLSKLLAEHAPSAQIIEHENAAPELCIEGQLAQCSISHSNGLIVAALMLDVDQPAMLGIDAELLRKDWREEKTAFFCAPPELDHGWSLESVEQRAAFFTRLWSCKEAYCKAHGISMLNRELNKLCLLEHPNLRHAKLRYDKEYYATVYCDPSARIISTEYTLDQGATLTALSQPQLRL